VEHCPIYARAWTQADWGDNSADITFKTDESKFPLLKLIIIHDLYLYIQSKCLVNRKPNQYL